MAPASPLFFGGLHVGLTALIKPHPGIELGQGNRTLSGFQNRHVIAIGFQSACHFIGDPDDSGAAHDQNADAVFFDGFLALDIEVFHIFSRS